MKKLSLMMIAASAMLMMQACGGSGSKDTVETADSVNETMDTTTSAVAADSAGVAEYDAKFAVDAANGGMTEVALSDLAKQKVTNADLKKFAEAMITDHKKAGAELTAIATEKNITLPGAPGEEQQKTAADLSAKTGKDFDKAYIDIMVKDHDKTVSLFEDASKNAVDADLKAFVNKTLPTLKAHQAHAHALQDKIK
jgi:putative membrane protein